MKKIAITLYLVPFGVLVWALDVAGRVCKWGYKAFHAAATVVSRYIRDVMDSNGL